MYILRNCLRLWIDNIEKQERDNMPKKILCTETINGLLTVDIDGVLEYVRIGDNISDDVGNVFRLDSAAMYNFYKLERSTLVLTQIKGDKPIGNFLLDTRLTKQQALELMTDIICDENGKTNKKCPICGGEVFIEFAGNSIETMCNQNHCFSIGCRGI